jgi:hypothetical protein
MCHPIQTSEMDTYLYLAGPFLFYENYVHDPLCIPAQLYEPGLQQSVYLLFYSSDDLRVVVPDRLFIRPKSLLNRQPMFHQTLVKSRHLCVLPCEAAHKFTQEPTYLFLLPTSQVLVHVRRSVYHSIPDIYLIKFIHY